MDDFLHRYINVVWLAKGTDGPPLANLHAFYKQRMSIVFQKAQAPSILKCVVVASEGSSRLTTLLMHFNVVASEGSSRLTTLLMFLSLSFSNMLFAIGGDLGT